MSKSKYKYSAWLSQTEIQSRLYNEKSAVYCVTYFLFSFDHGMLLVSQATVLPAGWCYSWWAAFSLCREHWVTPAWSGLGRACISTTLAYTTIYTCVKQEGKNSVLLNLWQFSASVRRCQKLRRGNVGGRQNCSFFIVSVSSTNFIRALSQKMSTVQCFMSCQRMLAHC